MTDLIESLAVDRYGGPLSSWHALRAAPGGDPGDPSDPGVLASPSPVPLALRELHPAPRRTIPDHVYDRERQVAVDRDGFPLSPSLKKEWTGDGRDHESWSWEEV